MGSPAGSTAIAPLAQLEDAHRLLAEARTFPELRTVMDLADVARAYARAAKLGLEAQNYAAEIKLRAERKAGELLRTTLQHGGSPKSRDVTLQTVGVTKMQSHRWQAVAAVPDADFEHQVRKSFTRGEELTTASMLRAASLKRSIDERPAPLPRETNQFESDQEALVSLLKLHAVPQPRILDVTHNEGRMWRGTGLQPHRLDADPQLLELGYTDTCADFRNLPFDDGSFDVLVFDPPHRMDTGETAMDGDWGGRYGLLLEEYRGQPSISFVFPAFLAEARRVLVQGSGIVLAKIADGIHGGAYQWHSFDLLAEAKAQGWARCDRGFVVNLERGTLVDPKWGPQQHLRQVDVTWLVLRNGPACRAVRGAGRSPDQGNATLEGLPSVRTEEASRRLDANRVMEGLVTQAAPSEVAIRALDWSALDRARIEEWDNGLTAAIKELTRLRARLAKSA